MNKSKVRNHPAIPQGGIIRMNSKGSVATMPENPPVTSSDGKPFEEQRKRASRRYVWKPSEAEVKQKRWKVRDGIARGARELSDRLGGEDELSDGVEEVARQREERRRTRLELGKTKYGGRR